MTFPVVKTVPYAPLPDVVGFTIRHEWTTGRKFLERTRKDSSPSLLLELREGGYTPRTALQFWDYLTDGRCKNEVVLDMGAGEVGILSFFAILGGAKQVDAVDVDPQCVAWLSHVIAETGQQGINVIQGDFFAAVTGGEYDRVLSNPPQTPMVSQLYTHTMIPEILSMYETRREPPPPIPILR